MLGSISPSLSHASFLPSSLPPSLLPTVLDTAPRPRRRWRWPTTTRSRVTTTHLCREGGREGGREEGREGERREGGRVMVIAATKDEDKDNGSKQK